MEELCRAIGVTRVARITGLDRAGVEVACAIRPDGHILQVSNGKGLTFARARAGAVLEAAELSAAEHVDPLALRFATRRELLARGLAAWGADALGSAGRLLVPALWSDDVRCAWREARTLGANRSVWIPAQALHCPGPAEPDLGPIAVQWTSNGMGAHNSRARALEHALLEAVERHQLAMALPLGWTQDATRRRVDLGTLPGAAARLERRFASRRLALFGFDLTPARGLTVPTAAALLFDLASGPVPLTAGYACAPSLAAAIDAATLEAAQSRLTDVHGAREDIAPADSALATILLEWCRAARPVRARDRRLRPPLARHLARAGFDRVAVCSIAPEGFPVHVLKVVVPGFMVSELLQ